MLGTFISEQFYAPFGERLSNDKPGRLGLRAQPPRIRPGCVRLDRRPGRDRGPERKAGTSISRPIEAEVIVSELSSGLQASTDLTFGVITFYSGQVTAIWEAMVGAGLAAQAR